MRVGRTCILALGLLWGVSTALAQSYPNRPITWVLGQPAGGLGDLIARIISKPLSEKLGQPIVIEYKTGAGGSVSAQHTAGARPDGYTIWWATSGPLATFQFLYKDISYDPIKSFTHIHGLLVAPVVLTIPAKAPFRSLDELVSYAKSNPGKLNYGSQGSGTGSHLAAEMLSTVYGIKMVHVPYRGSAPAILDLITGTLDLFFDFPVGIKPHVEDGKLRALVVSGPKRLAAYSTVPTFTELGHPEADVSSWAIVSGPPNMPKEVIDKLSRAFDEAMKDPTVLRAFSEQSVAPMLDFGPDKLVPFILSEQAKYKELIQRSGIGQ